MKDNKTEHAYLQTKLLELNLIGGTPQVVDTIFQNGILTHYDRAHVGKLCKQRGMWQRATGHYTNIDDIQSVFKNHHQMDPEFVIDHFEKLNHNQSILLIQDMMSRCPSNMQVCIDVAKKYHKELCYKDLIAVFEENKAYGGLYHYLGAIVDSSEDPFVHFEYIKTSCKLGRFTEAGSICRDSNIYDPEGVITYLMNLKHPDPRPLIYFCDRYDFIYELTEYLYVRPWTFTIYQDLRDQG